MLRAEHRYPTAAAGDDLVIATSLALHCNDKLHLYNTVGPIAKGVRRLRWAKADMPRSTCMPSVLYPSVLMVILIITRVATVCSLRGARPGIILWAQSYGHNLMGTRLTHGTLPGAHCIRYTAPAQCRRDSGAISWRRRNAVTDFTFSPANSSNTLPTYHTTPNLQANCRRHPCTS